MTDQVKQEFDRIDRLENPNDYKPKKPYPKAKLTESKDYIGIKIQQRLSGFRQGYDLGLKEGEKQTQKAINCFYESMKKIVSD